MSAEADQLDREAQQLDREAQQLEETAGVVERKGQELLTEATLLQQRFRSAVDVTRAGPQATRFETHNEARVGRMRHNEDIFRAVARRMRDAARRARDEARQKRDRAGQLRREEEQRNREAAARRH